MKSTFVPVVIALCAAAGLGGCGSSPSSTAPPAAATSSGFPVTVHPENGAVTITSRPVRILSLSASATRMLYAIGAGAQVAAVDKYSKQVVAQAPGTKLTGFETSAEDYVPYRPDLVIIADDTGTLVHQLGILHIPVLLLPAALTIQDTYSQVTLLGAATGHMSAAATQNATIRTGIARAVASVGDRAAGRTYYVETDPTLYSATSATFMGAIFSRLGMVNIADAAGLHANQGYPQLSAETIVQANPDFVFLTDESEGASAATFAARPGFSVLKAVKDHHVFSVPDSIASEWGPNVVDFEEQVACDVTNPSSRCATL